MAIFTKKFGATFLSGVSAITLSVALVSTGAISTAVLTASPAFADSHSSDDGDSHGSGGKGGQGGQGGQGGSDSDHDHSDGESDDHDHTESDDDHDHEPGEGGKGGQGGHDDDDGDDHGSGSDGKGKGSGGADAGKGERPVWAKEGIPEVELGRLNVARSPSHVLDRAYDEALSNFSNEMAPLYDMSLDQAAAQLAADFDGTAHLDSPLQNLALFKEALSGTSVLNQHDAVNNDASVLAAIFLGSASDKAIPIVPETAYAISKILGYELTESQASTLATNAEKIRQAIAEGHG